MTTFNRIKIKERLNEIATNMNDIIARMNRYSIDFYNEYDICVPDYEDALCEYISMLCDEQDTDQRKWIHDCRLSTQYIDIALHEMAPHNLNISAVIYHAQYLYYSDLIFRDYSKLEQLRALHQKRGELERELDQVA